MSINKLGKVIISEGGLRGRKAYDFYDLQGKKINTSIIRYIEKEIKDNAILFTTQDLVNGLVTPSGKIIEWKEFNSLNFLTSNMITYKQKGNNLLGLMSITGEIISSPKFRLIYDYNDGLAQFTANENLLFGYVDTTGKEIIPQIYDTAYSFFKGITLVVKDEELYLINTKGKIVKTFKGVEDYDVITEYGEDRIYKFDGEIYNYKGEKIDKK